MKTIIMMSLLLAGWPTYADQPAGRPQPSQSELALDHGPRAQVTPAVKRARQQAVKKASVTQSK